MLFSKLQLRVISLLLMVTLFFLPPYKKSEAVVPLVAMAYVGVTASGVSFSAADLVGLAIAATGLGALLYMKITTPDGSAIAIPAQDSAISPLAVVPSPTITNPVPTSVNVIASTTYNMVYPDGICPLGDDGAWSVNFTSQAQAVNAYVSRASTCAPSGTPSTIWRVCPSDSNLVQWFQSNTANDCFDPVTTVTAGTGTTCPVGYTLSGGACTLTNEWAVVDDKRQDIIRVGSVYSSHQGDRVGTIQGIVGITATNGDSLSFVGTHSPAFSDSTYCGQNCVSTVTAVANSNGSTTLTEYQQHYDITGQPFVTQHTLNIASSGSVASYSSQNLTGSIDANQTAANGGAAIVSAPANAIAPAPAAAPPIQIPTDYARTGEAATAASSINNHVDSLYNELSANSVTAPPVATLPTAPDLQNSVAGQTSLVTGMVDALAAQEDAIEQWSWWSWSPDFGAGTCQPFSKTIFGKVITWDVCPAVDKVKTGLDWMLCIYSIFVFYGLIFRRQANG